MFLMSTRTLRLVFAISGAYLTPSIATSSRKKEAVHHEIILGTTSLLNLNSIRFIGQQKVDTLVIVFRSHAVHTILHC
jgi:hypothetical protein